MTRKISQSIASFLLQKKIIDESKINIYSYGFEIIISDSMLLFMLFLLMLFFNVVLEMTLYLAVFIVLRHQAGGYHASSHFRCNCIFVSTFCVAMFLVKTLPVEYMNHISLIVLLIGALLIYTLAPIESENKPVSKVKMKTFRRNSLIYSAIVIAVAILTIYVLKMPGIALSIVLGLFSVGIALLAETIKRKVGER